ncbi:hypothetical protein [Streptomyces cinnamoneus]|uniref:hypothetical protein n=1 Tax=Streptomyces cinnamoneus TaxID=53446 RepID=UPI000C068911|nr:hypothetical protein [Streptomyces cinnamoneus]PPT11852.1 hypothetical protein CYQ11_02130 [Streptomyces cinnamoneus]
MPIFGTRTPAHLTADQQRVVQRRQAQRHIFFGAAWILLGVFFSLYTYLRSEGGFYVIWYGPAIWGAIEIARGVFALRKCPEEGGRP